MIHLFCALRCEAEPLISKYDLKYAREYQLFPIYLSRNKSISLTITGIGKLAASAAAMHTHQVFNGAKSDCWLNIGVAGHAAYNKGTVALANKITDNGTNKVWYPQVLFSTDVPSCSLLTLDKPTNQYNEGTMYDMEASGFYHAASRFATAELMHSIKIISDNTAEPAQLVTKEIVSELINAEIDKLAALIDSVNNIACELVTEIHSDRISEEILKRWHFTETERNSLMNLLRRWHVIFPDTSPLLQTDKTCSLAREFLHALTAKLDNAAIRYG